MSMKTFMETLQEGFLERNFYLSYFTQSDMFDFESSVDCVQLMRDSPGSRKLFQPQASQELAARVSNCFIKVNDPNCQINHDRAIGGGRR